MPKPFNLCPLDCAAGVQSLVYLLSHQPLFLCPTTICTEVGTNYECDSCFTSTLTINARSVSSSTAAYLPYPLSLCPSSAISIILLASSITIILIWMWRTRIHQIRVPCIKPELDPRTSISRIGHLQQSTSTSFGLLQHTPTMKLVRITKSEL